MYLFLKKYFVIGSMLVGLIISIKRRKRGQLGVCVKETEHKKFKDFVTNTTFGIDNRQSVYHLKRGGAGVNNLVKKTAMHCFYRL